jgi:filamentous hemagglutinin family protein
MASKKRFAALYCGASAGALSAAMPLFFLAAGTPSFANPLGGTVTTGSASIASPSAHQTDVDQTSEDVVVDWSSFNIGMGQTTAFVQPNAGAIAVNRIGGSAPSQIMGTLDANGRIVLINGNGMVFGKGSQVNVGSLVATTTGGSDSDVLAGKFTKAGNRNAWIVNQGSITASQGGLVALVAPHVSNSGTVSAKLGTIALGGANQFTVDFAGDGLVSFAAQGTGPATVANTGTLAGANVSLTARAAEGVATGVVTMSGTIVAQGAHEQGGAIILDAGDGGNVSVSNANLDASGANGGGKVTIGGWNENSVTVGKSSVIDASATNSGNGGTIETSGRSLAIGGTINAGKGGLWLFDPVNLTVTSAAATTIDTSLSGGTDVTLETTATGASGPGTTSSGPGDIIIDAALSWGTTAKLTLDAYNSILIDAPITVSGKGMLSLTTNFDGGTGGGLSFGGGDSVDFGRKNNGGRLTIDGAAYKLLYDMKQVQAINASSTTLGDDYALATSLNAKPVSGWIPIGTNGANTVGNSGNGFSGIFEGLGNTISKLTVDLSSADYVGLFGYSTGTIRDIGIVGGSMTGDYYVGGLVGYGGVLIGDSDVKTMVSGSNLVGGLAGWSADSITNSYATATVSDTGTAGGLVGYSAGTITNSYATGTVSGTSYDGGLVGSDGGGAITDSYATGAVTGTTFVGGLVGYSGGPITDSYATGAATGTTNYIGGLVGQSGGAITSSHATGAVSAGADSFYVGGLDGWNYGGAISDSYATGKVSGAYEVGGLVGTNYDSGAISDSYATGKVSGTSEVGGLVGYNYDGATISNAYSTGAVSGGSDVGGLVGYNDDGGTISDTYSIGAVSGSSDVGGLVGYDGSSGGISDSYWDTKKGGITNPGQGAGNIANDPGIAGLTTAQLQSGLPAGFDPTIWGESAGVNHGLPYLLGLPPS